MLKEIIGFEGRYFISDDGFVFNARMQKLKPHVNPRTGYCQQALRKDGKPHMRYIHRLVAEAFLVKLDYKCEVNHKDGDKQNNAVENLEWVTRSENAIHAYQIGLRRKTPVQAFTKDGKYIRTFPSVVDAKQFCGVPYNAGISKCLIGKAATAHGYVWKYAPPNG